MAEEKAQEQTLREALGAAFDEVTGAGHEEEESSEDVIRTQADVAEESDREALEETTEEQEASEEVVEEQEPEESPEEDSEDSEEEESLEPLKHWHKEDREVFKTLPREAQEFLLRRDKEFQASATKKQMEVSDIKKALEPVREDLVKYGVSDGDAIRRLVGAHVRLQENPKEAISWLMQSYGINPSDILGMDEERSGTRDDAAMREIQDLKNRLKEYENRTLHERQSTLQREIDEFSKDHEFFEEVQGEMATIARSFTMRGEPAPSLEQLYEKACWMNDDVRNRLIKKRQTEEQKRKAEESKKNLSKSKRAAQASVRSPRKTSGTQKESSKRSLREDLADAFDGRLQ